MKFCCHPVAVVILHVHQYEKRRLGETAAPGGGECRSCPDFASYTLAFALQLRKNDGKTSVGVT